MPSLSARRPYTALSTGRQEREAITTSPKTTRIIFLVLLISDMYLLSNTKILEKKFHRRNNRLFHDLRRINNLSFCRVLPQAESDARRRRVPYHIPALRSRTTIPLRASDTRTRKMRRARRGRIASKILRVMAGKINIQNVRRLRIPYGTVDLRAGHGGFDAPPQFITQRGDARGVFAARGGGELRRLANPTMPGTFSVPERTPNSWPPPLLRGQRKAAASGKCLFIATHIQCTYSFRPVHLVRGECHHIHPEERNIAI